MSLQQQRQLTATNVTTHVILIKNRSTKLRKWRGGDKKKLSAIHVYGACHSAWRLRAQAA